MDESALESPECLAAYHEGNACFATGNVQTAIACYRKSVDLDPGFFDGWHALGMALLKNGEVKEAIGCGLQATILSPNDLLAWTSLSQMYVQDGQIAQAEDAKGRARVLSLGGKIVPEST